MKPLMLTALLFMLSACVHTPVYEAQSQQPQTTRDYSRLVAEQLMQSGHELKPHQRVAVTSPVWLQGDFNQSPLVARQLQEEISAELHDLSLSIIEYKLSDGIRVTPQGDFALSKNYLELRELQNADYVLAATILEKRGGLTLNARLIDFQTQVVQATAQVTIPQHLIDEIRSDAGIELVAP
ncbi:FlgO family outer membrane protein [Aliidiomarina sp. Khilg15.8]